MRDGLSIVPYVRRRTVAGAVRLAGSLPSPQASIMLSQDGGRFQDSQITCDRFNDFWREGSVEQRPRETIGGIMECPVIVLPIESNVIDARETAGIPGLV